MVEAGWVLSQLLPQQMRPIRYQRPFQHHTPQWPHHASPFDASCCGSAQRLHMLLSIARLSAIVAGLQDVVQVQMANIGVELV